MLQNSDTYKLSKAGQKNKVVPYSLLPNLTYAFKKLHHVLYCLESIGSENGVLITLLPGAFASHTNRTKKNPPKTKKTQTKKARLCKLQNSCLLNNETYR